jgi:hypothetical protein
MTARMMAVAALLAVAHVSARAPAVVLRPVQGIPPHIAGRFREPLGFQQVESGAYYVFDRRGHTVYALDPSLETARKLVEIGGEEGHVLEPSAFDAEPRGTFVVADGPNSRERIQFFNASGQRIGGFVLPGRNDFRITIGSLVLNGVGSLQYTGQSLLINQPETGRLVTEYGLAGSAVRTFGALRRTGHEADRDVHLALNVGLPLVNPRGGYYFVFLGGVPMFRKYDREGTLEMERHMQGRELDPIVAAQPTEWPRRARSDLRVLPVVPPVVRAAAVDASGSLWVSFVTPVTYVFDPDGDKVRVVQFQATGLVAPTSLFFTRSGRLLVTPGCYVFDVR